MLVETDKTSPDVLSDLIVVFPCQLLLDVMRLKWCARDASKRVLR